MAYMECLGNAGETTILVVSMPELGCPAHFRHALAIAGGHTDAVPFGIPSQPCLSRPERGNRSTTNLGRVLGSPVLAESRQQTSKSSGVGFFAAVTGFVCDSELLGGFWATVRSGDGFPMVRQGFLGRPCAVFFCDSKRIFCVGRNVFCDSGGERKERTKRVRL